MTVPRLNTNILDSLNAEIVVPKYNRDQASGIVHLGVGAFHRAHQAVYFDKLLAEGHADWMITGASLRSSEASQTLNPQSGLFTLRVTDDQADKLRVIGSIKDVIAAREDNQALLDRLAAVTTKLVTLTITEKGYYANIATQALNVQSPDIQHDIANIQSPITTPGVLVAALSARRAAGLPPFTVLSCDNLPHNGEVTRTAVVSLADRISPELARWIDDEGAFPSSMVDRIVPAVSSSHKSEFGTRNGYHDAAMVKTEPFSQWVIEDQFCNERPKLESIGVEFTSSVAPWETLKLRMLNGAHSAMAYIGRQAGHEFVSDAIADTEIREFIHDLWDEIAVTLSPISGFCVETYRQDLLARFGNSTLQHRTHQIATDGSQKLPQRILAPLYDRHAKGLKSPALMRTVASWIKYLHGVDIRGTTYVVSDPMASTLREIVEASGTDVDTLLSRFTALEPIFGSQFKTSPELQQQLRNAFT